ncbi:MAG: hypothetical protein JW749_04585 [Sedimentisphaerales bacterium]|nr:hypothetical protein [Sedimentisphaerales bacterium]
MKHVILVIAAIMAAVTCQAGTIYVNANGSGDYPTIQDAVNNANHGDVIILHPGTYTGYGNRDIDFSGKAITIQSTDPDDPNIVSATIIDCQSQKSDIHPNPHRGFVFDNNEMPDSVLSGLTITNGWGGEHLFEKSPAGIYFAGGGILCKNSSPTIIRCRVISNTAIDLGGGICYWGGRPIISQCIISNNTTCDYLLTGGIGRGGGIYGFGEGTIVNCTVTENEAITAGGGIYCIDSKVSNCTIKNNTLTGTTSSSPGLPPRPGYVIPGYNVYGGGIYCSGNTQIVNCIIRENIATAGPIRTPSIPLVACSAHGGGVFVLGRPAPSKVTITNCTIRENSCEGGFGTMNRYLGSGRWEVFFGTGGDGLGGGVHCDPCEALSISIANCLIVANKSKGGQGGYTNYPDGNGFGGGVYCSGAVIKGTTFHANEAMDGAGIYGSPAVNNCILWDVVEQNSLPINEISGEAAVQYSNVKNGYPGLGNIDSDPCFVSPGNWISIPIPPFPNPRPFPPLPPPDLIWMMGDYHLLPDSPCIDTGDPNYEPTEVETDLDGNRRVAAGRIDMGAYEYPNAIPVADAGPNQVAYAWLDGPRRSH